MKSQNLLLLNLQWAAIEMLDDLQEQLEVVIDLLVIHLEQVELHSKPLWKKQIEKSVRSLAQHFEIL